MWAEAEAASALTRHLSAGQAGLLSKVLTVHGSWPGPVTPQPPDSDSLTEARGCREGGLTARAGDPSR